MCYTITLLIYIANCNLFLCKEVLFKSECNEPSSILVLWIRYLSNIIQCRSRADWFVFFPSVIQKFVLNNFSLMIFLCQT